MRHRQHPGRCRGRRGAPAADARLSRAAAMLFQLHDVTKNYGRITALRQLSVEAPTGAVSLLGPNGAGKTTLIRTLLGLISLDAGGGQVLGMDIRTQRRE